MIDEILKKKNAARILVKLLSGNVKMTDLKSIVSSYETLRYLIRDLEDLGYVKRREELKDRRIIYVELTEKGRVIAEKLKDIEGSLEEKEEPIAEISKEKYDQMAKDWNRLALNYITVPDEHVVLKEYNYDGQGHDRLVTISLSIDKDLILRLYCDVDQSTTCWHVQYAWTLPKVQAWVQFHLQKGDITRTDNQKEEK